MLIRWLRNIYCLQSKYSIRQQLWLSFGATTVLSLCAVVTLAVIAAFASGDRIEATARDQLKEQVVQSIRLSSEYLAHTISKKLESFEGAVDILSEATTDRIVGYRPGERLHPNSRVPFRDHNTGSNIYPLNQSLLPADWQVEFNVNETNRLEHLFEERLPWFENTQVSTKSASYRQQGACDPAQREATMPGYFPNCTAENTNFITGGVVHPTAVAEDLAHAAADLSVLLKPLFESHSDTKLIGIYFVNHGAGSRVTYPSTPINGTKNYTSIGCDWMRTTNRRTGRAFGTEEEIAKCAKEGDTVPSRRYNPLERSWCRNEALNDGRLTVTGPYLDASGDFMLLTIGQAVFDRLTAEFLACTLIDVSIGQVEEILKTSTDVFDAHKSELALLNWDEEGTVMALSNGSTVDAEDNILVAADLELCNGDMYARWANLVNFSEPWTPLEVSQMFKNASAEVDGRVIAAYPIPVPPSEYSESYVPEALLIQATGDDVFAIVDKMHDELNENIVRLITMIFVTGVVGCFILLSIIWLMSRVLTQPLQWMERMATEIVNHRSDRNAKKRARSMDLLVDETEEEKIYFWRCTPNSEITSLVTEFREMIQGFSGSGPAQVATGQAHEVNNTLPWRTEFEGLYFIDVERSKAMRSTTDTTEETYDSDRETPLLASMSKMMNSSQRLSRRDLQSSIHSMDPDVSSLTIADIPSQIEEAPSDIHETESTKSSTSRDSPPLPVAFSQQKKPSRSIHRQFPTRVNLGHHLSHGMSHEEQLKRSLRESMRKGTQVRRSKLFWWIVLLIVLPLLVVTSIITYQLTRGVQTRLPKLLEETEDIFIAIERQSIRTSAAARATFGAEVLKASVRDIHLLTRYAGWIFGGAITQSDGLTEMEMNYIEECKRYFDTSNQTCPFENDLDRRVCDCEWNDVRRIDNAQNESCKSYATDSRNLQYPYFGAENDNNDPVTGDRHSTSWPVSSSTPGTTSWWTSFDIDSMPGAEQGSNATGAGTLYSRFRALSAMGVVQIPLYNYGSSHRLNHLGVYIGMEADGGMNGYDGCNHGGYNNAEFSSTEENRAAILRPDLCPLKKHGYDPRCRGWYDAGMNKGKMLITAPYVFGDGKLVGSSITTPLNDTKNGYIGQVLIDFVPQELFSFAVEKGRQECELFSIIVTPEPSEQNGGDTVWGPGYDIGSPPPKIENLLFQEGDEENRDYFVSRILDKMKSGEEGDDDFTRKVNDSTQELFIAYAPLELRSLQAIDPTEFERGVEGEDSLIYSVAVIASKKQIHSVFGGIQGSVKDNLRINVYGFYWATMAISVVTVAVSVCFAVAITRPVVLLLKIVQSINARELQESIPPMNGGSKEVNQVYLSFAKLYKIVQFSNSAFFSGNMFWAYKFLCQALDLFRNVNDKKAIAIASNNLGNTLLSIYKMKASPSSCCLLDGHCVRGLAIGCYDEAIATGTAEYNEALRCQDEGSDDLRAAHAAQLANRHFNRALCLLLTRNDPCSDESAERRGIDDLIQVRQYDSMVRDYWISTRQVQKNSSIYFDRLLRRSQGLAIPSLPPDLKETWDIRDLMHEADSLLFAIGRDSDSPLLKGVNRVGRLQQLEEIAIRSKLSREHDRSGIEAARVAIRMLVEDENLLESPFAMATEALMSTFHDSTSDQRIHWSETSVTVISEELRAMARKCRRPVEAGKNIIFCVNSSVPKDNAVLEELQPKLSRLFHEVCRYEDFFALVSFGSETEHRSSSWLAKRSEAEEELEDLLKLEINAMRTDSPLAPNAELESCGTALNHAISLVEGSTSRVAKGNDTWIVLVTNDLAHWTDTTKRAFIRRVESGAFRDSGEGYRSGGLHVVVVALDMEEEDAAAAFEELCQPKKSLLIPTTSDKQGLDAAFFDVSVHIQCRGSIDGLTMEKF